MSLRSFSIAILFASAVALGGSCYAATIAITEFIIDPFGADDVAPEWIELFNYGDTQPTSAAGRLKTTHQPYIHFRLASPFNPAITRLPVQIAQTSSQVGWAELTMHALRRTPSLLP